MVEKFMIEKTGVEKSGVEKLMVEKSGVERSRVKAWCSKGPGVEISFTTKFVPDLCAFH